MIIVILLLSLGIAYADVDYWGIKTQKHIKVEKKVESKNEFINGDKLLEESKKWYYEKIRKEKPPIEFYFFKDPKKYKKQYYTWLKWKREKEEELMRNYLAEAKANLFNLNEAIKYLQKKGYSILYFYKPDCPYCKAEQPEIEYLSNYFQIYKVNIYKKPIEAMKWRIKATPTIIAVSPREKKAYRVEGYIDAFSLIKYFYTKSKEEQQ